MKVKIRNGVELHCGDCLEILPTLKLGSVDAVVTDPPYGKGFHDGGLGKVPSAKWRNPSESRFEGTKIIGDAAVDVSVVPLLEGLLKIGGALYLFSQWMVEAEWISALKKVGLPVRNRLVWVKPKQGAGDLQTTFAPQHESIIYAAKRRHELRGRRDSDVWSEGYSSNGCFDKGKVHPNQKPIKLLKWLIKKSTNVGEIVLDPFMGSGTTGVACVQTGRKFIGIEIDPKYFAIAKKRIEQAKYQETFGL